MRLLLSLLGLVSEESKRKILISLKANDMISLIYDLDQKLRDNIKYSERLMDSQEVRDILHELLIVYKIDFDELYN